MEREEKIRRQREFLTGVAYWGVWIAGAVFLLKLLGSVLFPFAIAFLVAVLLTKPVDFIAAKCHLKRGAAAVGCVLLLYAAVGVLCYLLGARIITLAYDSMLGAASFLTDTMLPALESIAERVETAFFGMDGEPAKLFGRETSGLLERAGKVLDGVNDSVMKKLSEAAMGIPGICLKVLFTVIATVFMELDYHTMMAFLARQFPDKKRKLIFDCKKNMLHMFGRFVFSYGIILTLTFAELFAGLLLLRVEGALVIAFVIAVLDILPVLGTGTVLVGRDCHHCRRYPHGSRNSGALRGNYRYPQCGGAEVSWKADRAFTDCHASLYVCWAQILWNSRNDWGTSGSCVTKKFK